MKVKNKSLIAKIKKQYRNRRQSVKHMYLQTHTINPADYYIRAANTEIIGK